MGRNYLQIFIGFLFCVSFSGVSFSSENSLETLNFESALKLAFDQNPKMIEARKAIDVSRGDLLSGRTFRNPEVELEIDSSDSRLNSFEIKQPLAPIGVRFLASQIASGQVQIQKQSLRLAWASVYVQVRETYSNVVLDIKELQLAEDNLNAMRQFFGRVQERYQSGQALKNDFQRAKIELLQAQHDYLAAEKDLKTDKARLNLALGRPIETAFEVHEKLAEEDFRSSFEYIKSIALVNHPDIKIAELELKSRKENLSKEKLTRLPSYFVGFKGTDEEQGEDDYAILAGFSIPLWNLNQGEVKKANAQLEAQMTRSQAVTEETMFNIYQAYLDAELAQKHFELSKKSVEEANELFRLANLHYSEGEIDFLNYLDQIKTARQAKVNYQQCLFHLSHSISVLEASIYSSLRQEEFFNEKF